MDFAFGPGLQPVLKRVWAKNFRTFRDVTFRPGALSAVVGANAAGKTSLVDLFRFQAEATSLGLYTALERRGGLRAVRHSSPTRPRNMTFGVELEYGEDAQWAATYEFRIRSEAGGSYSIAEEDCRVTHGSDPAARLLRRNGRIIEQRSSLFTRGLVKDDGPSLQKDALALPVFSGIPELGPVVGSLRELRSYAIVPDKLRELQEPDEGEQLEPDGKNAASVLRHLEAADREELIEMLAYVVPGVLNVRDASHGTKLTLEFTQTSGRGKSTFEAYQMSDGTLRLLGLLLALYQRKTPWFVAIEEPEATIHVAALRALIEVFAARSERTQIVLTTHSAEIIDALPLDAIHLVVADGGHSRLTSVSADTRKAVEEALFSPGELLRTGALAGAD